MADENFDPYYTWLGIRPEEQPPDHYRLIGLRQFEENGDVIANAADRQMQFLRSMQVGKRSALSQKLLNEISAAGGCLLDPQRKAKYDQELKAKEAAKAQAAKPAAAAKAKPLPKAAALEPIPRPVPLAAKLPEPDLFSLPMPQNAYAAPVQTGPNSSTQRPAPSNLPLILGGVGGGVVLLLIVVVAAGMMLGGGSTKVAKKDKDQTVKKDGTPGSVVPVEKRNIVTPTPKPVVPEETVPATPNETVKPVSTPAAAKRPQDWSYGIGAFDQNSNRVNLYSPLKHWTGDAWQVSKERPDEESGWIYIDAAGGSTGYKQIHSPIRRWTAPQAGKLAVTGELKHFHADKKGDGIRGRLASSRGGLLGEWTLLYSSAKTDVSGIDVQAGDQIDFVVDVVNDWTCDTFTWEADLRLTDAQGKELGTWNSAADFHGPLSGQVLASADNSNPPTSPATTSSNWTPPARGSTRIFRSMLGNYMFWLDRRKLHPIVNLQVPKDNNLWSRETQEKLRGQFPFDEMSYAGTAKIAVPEDGIYLVDVDRGGRVLIDGVISGGDFDQARGDIKISKGVHSVTFEMHSHGQQHLQDAAHISLKNKQTGKELEFFNTWQDIEEFLGTPVEGKRVTEISNWEPSETYELKLDPQLLASGGIKAPLTPVSAVPAVTGPGLPSPVHSWSFEEESGDTVADSGQGDSRGKSPLHLAGWGPSQPRFVRGRIGNALRFYQQEQFAATDRYVDFPKFTIAFWLKVLGEQGINPRIAHPWVELNYEHQKGVGALGLVTEPAKPDVAKWHHYVVTINQETRDVAIFRDGVLKVSGKLGDYESRRNVKYWAFGHNQDRSNPNDSLHGELDELKIYDKYLTAAEVRSLASWELDRANGKEIDPAKVAALAAKAPVPAEAARAAAQTKIASIFDSELKGAKTAAAKKDLAKNLLDVSASTTDPAERYVLLSESRRLATEAKDLGGAMLALEALGSDYEIDVLSDKAKLLQGLAGGTLTPVQRGELITAVCEVGQEALGADNLEAVTTLVLAARSLATKATAESKAEAKEFTDLAAQRQKRMETLKKAEQTLATSPDNPAANLVVGLHTFFVREKEPEGLAMLAKGSDAKLAAAAKAHADNVAKGAETSPEEADAWYDAITTVPVDYKVNVQRKALESYTLLASSGTGLAKAKADKRRQELAAALPIGADQPTKRLKMSDVPEKSPGMVGRVLVDGKDAGILVTTRPQHELHEEKLASILAQANVKRARLILIGTFHCDTAGEFRAWHLGREGGLAQVISMDGKPFSFAGGTYDRGGDHRINIPAGDHVIQWVIDFDLSSRPALQTYFGTPQRAEKFDIFATRRQSFEARKIPTSIEVDLNR